MIVQQKVVLIGAGNVATHLGIAMNSAGFCIAQVWSRTASSSKLLAKQLSAESITDIKKLTDKAGIYILCVKDDATEKIAKKIRLKHQIIVHTSGSIEMSILKKCSKNYGVIYPLQTFSINKNVSFNKIPICIEANNKNTETTLIKIANHLSNNVHIINSKKRKILHLSAVLACNFTNHMYTLAEEVLKKNKLPFDILFPLIEETAKKIEKNSPSKMQTGPAIRKDIKTINKHLKLLSGDLNLQNLYKTISDSISKKK